MSIRFNNPGAVQYIDFGSPAGVIGLTTFTISYWYKPNGVGAVDEETHFIIWDGTGTDSDQYITIYRPDPVEKKLTFDAHFSTTNGRWTTTNNVLNTAGIWYHIVLTYDGSATGNNPKIYINGVSVAVTRGTAPVGTFRTGTSANLKLGEDTYTAFVPDGYMDDPRIYNVVLTASQVLALFNAGPCTPNFDTNNLVWNPNLRACTALGGSAFNDFVLTSSQKFYDRIGCAQGTPSGSPLGSDDNPT